MEINSTKSDFTSLISELLIVFLLINFFVSCQSKKLFEDYNCPCRLIDKKETSRGYQVTIINKDSVKITMLSKEVFQYNINEIIE